MDDNSGISIYPRDSEDPSKKTKEWGIQYAKAAYYDYSSFPAGTCFYQSAARYEEIKLYALGMQPNTKYKKLLAVDEVTDDTWLNIDWSIHHAIGTIRDIAISRMCQQEYSVVATPIDADAKTKLSDWIAKMKAKITVREMAAQADPKLAQHPSLTPDEGEPEDLEELKIRLDFGEAFTRSKDAEEMIQLGLYWNDEKALRRKFFEDLFDFGLVGYQEDLGPDAKPVVNSIDREAIITNYCRKANFSDLRHVGNVIDVDLVDLAMVKNEDGSLMFTDDQLEQLASTVAGKWGNPGSQVGTTSTFFKGYDRFKCKVLHLKFFSYNNLAYSSRKNRYGNPVFAQENLKNVKAGSDKYVTKRVQVVYEIKWIIGTEFAYDFGLKKDMPRSKNLKKKALTSLGTRLYAPNFYEMRAKSMMDRLIPLQDDFQMNVYKLRNLHARMVPDGWWIDLDGLEGVRLEAGGQAKSPKELLQLFTDTGILVGRTKDIMGDNVNYKPILPMANTNYQAAAAVWQEMVMQIQQMKAVVGLNDVTDSSTPNPKTLNGVATMMDQGTNNSLYPMQFAEKWIMQKLAGDIYLRMQQAIDRGDIEGYIPALNSNTLKYVSLAQGSQLDDCGIMLEERPTEDQKQFLIQNMQADVANGIIDSSDVVMVANTYNIKAAQMLLAYKAKKGKEALQQNQMAQLQQQSQGNNQSAQLKGQLDQQLEVTKHGNKMQEIDLQGQWELKKEMAKQQGQQQIASEANNTKLAGQVMGNMPPGSIMPQQQPNPAQEQNVPEEAMQ